MTTENNAITNLFGLSQSQLRILFSMEKFLTEQDIKQSEEKKKKDTPMKVRWLQTWTHLVQKELGTSLFSRMELVTAIKAEKSAITNLTGLHMCVLEATLFVPYSPLGVSTDNDKDYKKLKFENQSIALKSLIEESCMMDSGYVDRFQKTYTKSIDKLSGKLSKIALGAVSVVAIAGVTAATAGVLAGPIAVALVGGNFVLSGAALTSASLALLGGGAIAAGGAGMAGGVIAIVAGGALLGAAGGGTIVGSTALLLARTPNLALSQSAKLEVALKEIILNAQQDILLAQDILKSYKETILKLNQELSEQRLSNENSKTEIANLKKSIGYMEKAYAEMNKFSSAYKVGVAH